MKLLASLNFCTLRFFSIKLLQRLVFSCIFALPFVSWADTETEPNGTYALSNTIVLPGMDNGTISLTGDIDWYNVSATAGASLVTTVSATATALDAAVSLYGSDGITLLAQCSACGGYGGTDIIQYNIVSTGTYYLRVSAVNGIGSYTIECVESSTIKTLPLSSNTLQPGSAVNIGYAIIGLFNAGNIFTAQLSNSSGNFSSPVVIGNLASTLSGNINATIPLSTMDGNNYRIRVVSSSPVITGSDNGDNIMIQTPITITTGTIAGSPFCPEVLVNVPFTATGNFADGNIYTAELSDKQGIFTSPTAIGTLNTTANSGTVKAVIPSDPKAASKYRIRVTSSNPSFIGTDNGSNLKLIACDKVTALSISGITATSATVNWTGVSCVSKYKVQYRKQGAASWTSKYSTTNSYTISGLIVNTAYEYRVQTYCTASGSAKSGFTSTASFATTLKLGIEHEASSFEIAPNPFSSSATISFSLQEDSYILLELFDVTGRKLQTVLDANVTAGNHEINLHKNQSNAGIYFLQMKINGKRSVKKIIIE